jgi:hypothetical protein
MPDLDVFERVVDRAMNAATAAADRGDSVEEIADELARGLRRLVDRCLACPALEAMGEALTDFYAGLDATEWSRESRQVSALWLELFRRVEVVERRWFDLPCTRVASLAAQRVAVDAERAVAVGAPFDVWRELDRRYVEALADNVWLSRVASRLGRRPVAWADDLLRALGTRVAMLVGRWNAPVETVYRAARLRALSGGDK